MPSYGGFRRTSAAAAAESSEAGSVLLESVSDWSSQPAGWRNLHGDKDETITTLSYASGGLTMASKDTNSKATNTAWSPVGVAFTHTSNTYTATATFDNLSVGGVDSTDDWWISIMHSDGLVPHGSTGEMRFYYDKNESEGSATNAWQAYKVHRRSGETSLSWSAIANVTDTTPTGLKLRLQFDDAEGFKASYSIDTGSGYGAFANVPSDTWQGLEPDASASEVTPNGWGPRVLTIAVGNYGDMSSSVSALLVDLEVTGAA